MDDSDYEEESAVFMVELQGVMSIETLLESKVSKILEPESETPILQFGNYVFKGKWEDTLGTVVCFEKPESEEKTADKEKPYNYAVKTDRKLSLQRIFLEEKSKEQKCVDEVKITDGHITKKARKEEPCENGDINHAGTSGFTSQQIAAEVQEHGEIQDAVQDLLTDVVSVTDCYPADSSSSEVKATISMSIDKQNGLDSQESENVNSSSDLNNISKVNNGLSVELQSPVGVLGAKDSFSAKEKENPLSSTEPHPSPTSEAKDEECVSEAENKSLGSSEAEFVILSEVECSNDAEYSTGSVEKSESAADSSVGINSSFSRAKVLLSNNIENLTSHGEAIASNGVISDGNSVVQLVDSLLTEVQAMHFYNDGASTSGVMEHVDVADSASSFSGRERQSESSLPLICDSATGEGKVKNHLSKQEFEDDDDDEEMDVSIADCSEVSQISTSSGLGISKRYPAVFEDEAMDTTENVTQTTHNDEIDSDSVGTGDITLSQANEENLREVYVSSEGIREPVSNFRSVVQDDKKSGEVSTSKSANGSSNLPHRVSDSLESDSRISHSSAYQVPENLSIMKDSGLIDSTSNKIGCTTKSMENNLKNVPGIDSTTNDSGRKHLSSKRESSENSYNNASAIPNERIDSTMNNLKIPNPTEDVDFEMREATNLIEVEETESSGGHCVEESQPIDSTSGRNLLQTSGLCTVSNTAESSAADLQDSPKQSHTDVRNGRNRNSSPCNVTESHIDERKQMASLLSSSAENSHVENSEVTVSSERSDDTVQEISESDNIDHKNGDVAESSQQDDRYDQVTESCASTSRAYYENLDESEVDNADEDSVNQVTESIQTATYSSSHEEKNASTHEVTDSTNISCLLPASEDLDESSLVLVEDSSICEVTESSSYRGEGILVIDEGSSSDILESDSNEVRDIYSQQRLESPSSVGIASGSEVSESRRFGSVSFFSTDHNSSSCDGKEPSSSGLTATSESQAFEACSSAGVISSAESEVHYYSSASAHNLSANEVNISSASGYWASPLDLLVQASEYEVSNSSERNADSTEGDNRSSPNSRTTDASGDGLDNSKLPSSTSN